MKAHPPSLVLKIKFYLKLCLVSSLAFSFNNDPIVLIHGFMGWGRDEMNGYHYWGGKTDLEQYLKSKGFQVITVSVGPISSNWDRAVEAFYQIKGGQLDYGKSHSDQYQLIQKPESHSFDGFYGNWGSSNPIHIISHSQGGQTARMLEYLLSESFSGEESELLSTSHRGWIKSITTISTPHNGTVLANIISDNLPFLQRITPLFGSLGDLGISKFYDFDLQQWGLSRIDNESVSDYLDRIAESRIGESKNFCSWDLSIEGATKFNDVYITDPDVYYFSQPTFSTKETRNSNHFPDSKMSLMSWIPSIIIGNSDLVNPDWHMNDGVVSTVSMRYPVNSQNISAPNKPFDEQNIQKGVWQVMTPINQDHHIVIGHKIGNFDSDAMKNYYFEICDRLYRLE